jgi:hypothetical protein
MPPGWLPLRLTFSYEYTPFAGNAFEGVEPTVAEAQPRASHQILHGAGYRNLVCAGERRHTRAYVNGDSTYIVADRLALPGVKAGTDFDSERPDFFGHGAGAANATRRAVERGQKAIASQLDLMASEAR